MIFRSSRKSFELSPDAYMHLLFSCFRALRVRELGRRLARSWQMLPFRRPFPNQTTQPRGGARDSGTGTSVDSTGQHSWRRTRRVPGSRSLGVRSGASFSPPFRKLSPCGLEKLRSELNAHLLPKSWLLRARRSAGWSRQTPRWWRLRLTRSRWPQPSGRRVWPSHFSFLLLRAIGLDRLS